MDFINVVKSIFSVDTNRRINKEDKDRKGVSSNLFVVSDFDGETTPGEIGIPKVYRPEFRTLRVRSWQSYYESEITQTIIKKYIIWVVGSGLRLQSEPVEFILEDKGIKLDKNKFSKQVEAKFKLWAKSNRSTFDNKYNLNKCASVAKLNSAIAGDVLVILRYKDKNVSVQLVDAEHICTPFDKINSKIIDGVEYDSNGKEKNFYINGNENPVKAYDSKGRRVAFMVYGNKYRIDDRRGMPMISAVLQSIKVLERYKEAVVGSAEERQKIPFTIEHDAISTGENPLRDTIATSLNKNVSNQTSYEESKGIEGQIRHTQQKEVYNMPNGAKLKALESKSELYFKEFYDTNFEHICGVFCIPPDVAKSMYNSSYSASRAAIKDFEHVLRVDRSSFSDEFYKPIFEYWLDTMVLSGEIEAPGYEEAINNNNLFVLDAYRNCRFVGPNVPHIDPLKEVKAERAKLGVLADNVPLSTVESSIERIDDGGDYDTISGQFKEEIALFPNDKENKQ